ncbi:MAG: 2-C-methyl-D-erythritol 2,4-cyclodiphosphate synthase [Acidobacteriota bacterium]|nr:2-C-methyl-D-erythritol 2,4-cyclodiphosphate synthase [Acidobacteriota bacterium]
MDARVGLGYDLHRLVKGRPLYLGGVEIPYAKGLLGHSDGDVLVHAVIDALLGAAGENDIGTLFPDTDARTAGVRSLALLDEVMAVLKKRRLRVRHVDVVVVAERPKIGPHAAAIKAVLGPRLGLRPDRLGIKAKTNEGTGTIGRGGAIACLAVVCLTPAGGRREKKSPRKAS